jgi:hypothetical protein
VSPPLREPFSSRNSYPGNLPRELEYEKLDRLTDRIVDTFGARPTAYLAGRYGAGPNTAEILDELGYQVDLSACVPMDLSDDGGPDYSSYSSDLFWFGDRKRVLAIPGTGGYIGWWPMGKRSLYHMASHPSLVRARMPGILARLGMVDRLRLTPEGYTTEEMRRLTTSLLDEGLRVFMFSFHSPSMSPGFTPYVQSADDLHAFLMRCREYFAYFLEELEGVAMTPLAVRQLLEDAANTPENQHVRGTSEER